MTPCAYIHDVTNYGCRESDDPQKAEAHLLDALKVYVREKWSALADDTRVKLAECYLQQNCDARFEEMKYSNVSIYTSFNALIILVQHFLI